VKTIPTRITNKEDEFAKAQEVCQKDIKRASSFLQAHGLACFWDKKSINNIMTCCVILHNMTIDEERDLNLNSSMTMLVAE
jgi:hypothetical protein